MLLLSALSAPTSSSARESPVSYTHLIPLLLATQGATLLLRQHCRNLIAVITIDKRQKDKTHRLCFFRLNYQLSIFGMPIPHQVGDVYKRQAGDSDSEEVWSAAGAPEHAAIDIAITTASIPSVSYTHLKPQGFELHLYIRSFCFWV